MINPLGPRSSYVSCLVFVTMAQHWCFGHYLKLQQLLQESILWSLMLAWTWYCTCSIYTMSLPSYVFFFAKVMLFFAHKQIFLIYRYLVNFFNIVLLKKSLQILLYIHIKIGQTSKFLWAYNRLFTHFCLVL